MGALAAGIFSHAMTAAQALTNTNSTPAPEAAGTGSTSTSSATISANDFLTLLVTEMKNQDPTANTDPNEYINQLVNVNSLQQLISINQNITDALGTTSKSAVTTGQVTDSSNAKNSAVTQMADASLATQSATSSPAAGGDLTVLTSALKRATGNLTVPDAIPAAHTVASALGGKLHAHSIAGGPR